MTANEYLSNGQLTRRRNNLNLLIGAKKEQGFGSQDGLPNPELRLLMANFSLGEFKPDNVYQKIHAMQAEQSSHASDIFYLFVDADVNWGSGLNREPKHVYTIVIQYSATLGHNPDLQQPAHILEEDALEVSGKYHLFIRERNEYWEIQKALHV